MIEKYLINHPYLVIAFIVVSLATIWIVLFTNTEEKTPATGDQVSAELVELGYEPADVTDYYEQYCHGLKKTVFTQSSYIRFFELNNNDNAGAVYRNWYHQIKEATGGAVYSSTEDYYNYSGFYVYDDMYYHLVWVDNTVVMAFGGKNYKNDIFKILEAIGY